MSMIAVLRQIKDADINPLLNDPERILVLLDEDEIPEEEKIEPEVDLDKAWHGIHYLLTGSAWEGDPPLSYLVHGGQPVGDVDVGYGPARVLRPDEVHAFDRVLSTISPDELRFRFDPQAMMKAEIYPEIWDRDPEADDALGYVLEYFEVLQSFVHETSKQNKGLIIYLT